MAACTDQDIISVLLERDEIPDSTQLCQEKRWNHLSFVGSMKSLLSLEYIEASSSESVQWVLTQEGEETANNGSVEFKVYQSIPAEGISMADLKKLVGEKDANLGFGKAKGNKWITLEKGVVKKVKEDVADVARDELRKLDSLSKKDLLAYKKRKLVNDVKIVSWKVSKAPGFRKDIVRFSSEITSEMLVGDAWKEARFKSLNIGPDVRGVQPQAGNMHTLLKFRSMMREIFLEMGFSEMPTNRFVESSFWNFDALFQPQAHPARDAHDTFFMKDPAYCNTFLDTEYKERVRNMHSHGGQGSLGWNYEWSEAEAKRNILRTHTTAISARMLYNLAQQETFKPTKMFSIDRVFRNETLDATHLAEFHQIEGLVADYDLTLGHLMGIIREFFAKLGITKLRFKPAYNPYTEPSMEVFSWHEGTKKWLEIGNSGMFRPEMLLPMGLPENVRVIAWGFGLERPVMIRNQFKDIRDLFGHKMRLAMIENNTIATRELV